MTKINTQALENALDSLQRSIVISKQYLLDPKASIDLKETLQAGVIQNFEFSYELSFKTLKRQLEKESATPSLIDGMSFQELIREGAEKTYIQDPKKWLVYRHQRNLTSQTYRADYAKSVYQSATEFYDDAHNLLIRIQEKNR
ncbi:MAG: HI0074 family nucleotidyltransferase substrate-binding subunit [Gammaproteobacteria bacterium]|nr:HI0074 family nucleotidyltransferase substrate-binding subunit [Gammaproteobacteria bacterium]